MLIWYAYISQYDHHQSMTIISWILFHPYLFLPSLCLKIQMLDPSGPSGFVHFSLGLFSFCCSDWVFSIVLSSSPFILSFVLSFHCWAHLFFTVIIIFCSFKISVYFFYISFVPLLTLSLSSFLPNMFIIAHWSILMISSLEVSSDNSNICFLGAGACCLLFLV